MAHLKNIYLGSLRTEIEHVKSGQKFVTDAPVDNNGKGEAISPTDTLCAALSSCMVTIMAMAGEKHHISLQGMSTEIVKIMASNPRRVSEIEISFRFPAGLELTAPQKKMLEEAALTCPVALSIHPDIKKRVNFNF